MNWDLNQKPNESSTVSEVEILKKRFPLPEPTTLVYYYLQQQILKLGKRLQIRQAALATAQVYLLRFYSTVEIRKTNPYLILTTAFYLACKTEECPQHIRMVCSEARNFWPDHMQGVETPVLGECEFVLIQELNAQLVVHHPYGDLMNVKDELGMTQDETTLAWHAINDFHATSMLLTHSPRTIAAAAISVVLTVRPSSGGIAFGSAGIAGLRGGSSATGNANRSGAPRSKQQKLAMWLAHGDLNIEAVVECTQELISLYAALDKYSENACKQQLGAIARARGIAGV